MSVFDISAPTASALSVLAMPRETHIKHRVTEDGPRMCRRCNAEFDDIQELAKHVKEHLKPMENRISGRYMKKKQLVADGSPKKRGRGRPPKVQKKALSKVDPNLNSETSKEPISDSTVDLPGEGSDMAGADKDMPEKTAIKIVDVTKQCTPVLGPENEDETKVISTVLNIKGSAGQSPPRRSLRNQRGSASGPVPFKSVEVVNDGGTESDIASPNIVVKTQTRNQFAGVVSALKLSVGGRSPEKGVTADMKLDSISKPPPPKRRRVGMKIPETTPPGRASRRDMIKNCTITFDDNKQPIHKCNHCCQTFSKLEGFAKHMNNDHGASVKCHHCSLTFLSNDIMQQHKCSALEEVKPVSGVQEAQGPHKESPKQRPQKSPRGPSKGFCRERSAETPEVLKVTHQDMLNQTDQESVQNLFVEPEQNSVQNPLQELGQKLHQDPLMELGQDLAPDPLQELGQQLPEVSLVEPGQESAHEPLPELGQKLPQDPHMEPGQESTQEILPELSQKLHQDALMEPGEEAMEEPLPELDQKLHQDALMEPGEESMEELLQEPGQSLPQDPLMETAPVAPQMSHQGIAQGIAPEHQTPPDLSAVVCMKEKDDEVEIYSCSICGKNFEKLKYLLRHVRGHTDAFHCVKCHKRFARKESLQKHQCICKHREGTTSEEVEDTEGPYFCEFCGTEFRQKKYLFRHMAAHTGEFKCKKCKREFSRKESLLQHIVRCCPEMAHKEGAGVYPCPLCNRVFSREVSLQNHMKLHTGDFKCEQCNRCFASQFSLEKHICGDLAETGGKLACSQCGKTFTKEMYLQRHMTIHTGDFSCVICSRQFSRKEELVKHMLECTAMMQVETEGEIKCTVCSETFADPPSFRIHYAQHTHPYKCEPCGRMFLRKSNLDSHKCNPLTGDPVDCTICKKKFRHLKYLQRHMVVHSVPKYTCNQCNRKFQRLDHYNNHTCKSASGETLPVPQKEKTAYPGVKGEKQAICPTCGKSYVTVSNLNKHMKTHGEKNETCDVCGKRFHLKVALREHIESVHTEEYKHQCQYCGKFMKCKNSLFGHVRQFHSQTITLYACDQCGRKFRQKGNLKKHILTHSDNKTFKCQYCVDKSFKYPEQLRRHQLWHTEGQRFQCEFCKRKFVMQFELRKHMRIFHSGIMYMCEYCFTECRHFHTMKRHLYRRHSDEPKWQADPTAYIKGLVRENPDNTAEASNNIEKDAERNTVLDESDLHIQIQPQIANALTPIEEQPFIVAEVSGFTDGGAKETTRTVIIQTAGQQFNNGLMSQEMAAALQSLSKQGALDENSTMTIIQNLGNGEGEVLPLPEGSLADEQGFIIVPMLTAENTEEGMNVFNNVINTEILQS